MRILLIKPKPRLNTVNGLHGFYLLEPLELGYLAAAVPDGHEVKILDLRLSRRPETTLRRTLNAYRPDLVGFTGYTHESSLVKAWSKLVRVLLPGARVVAGGHHATVEPSDYNVPDIDFIVRGEGCKPFTQLIEALDRGVSRAEIGASISQLLTPGDDFDHASARSWPRYPDPATLPVPRRDLWDKNSYRCIWTSEEMTPWAPLYPPVSMVRASWGCKMKCTFCVVPQLSGSTHRANPAERAAAEIADAPADHIYFCDDENFIDEAFAHELADALERRGVSKRYFAWTRAATVNRSPELFRRWRALGLDAIFMGFEFITVKELKAVKKGGSPRSNERALNTLRSLGIAVHAAFMVQPDYDEDQFRNLRDYVRALPPAQCSFTVCTPSPGSEDYAKIKPEIWIDRPHDLHDCMHALTPTKLPLKRFSALYAQQVAEGTAKTPLRHHRHPLKPHDIWRVWRADRFYARAFRDGYKDYPKALWA